MLLTDIILLQIYQVWLSYAQFEMSTGQEDCVAKARHVFSKANQTFKENAEAKEERMMVLDAWKQHEVVALESVLGYLRL